MRGSAAQAGVEPRPAEAVRSPIAATKNRLVEDDTGLSVFLARRRELAIRIALGSAPSAIRRLILRDALLVSGIGSIVGLLMALVATRFMRALPSIVCRAGPSDVEQLSARSDSSLYRLGRADSRGAA